MTAYTLAIDPQTNRAYVMEKSTDFEGWVVLFHCLNLDIAQRVMASMVKAEENLWANAKEQMNLKPGAIIPGDDCTSFMPYWKGGCL